MVCYLRLFTQKFWILVFLVGWYLIDDSAEENSEIDSEEEMEAQKKEEEEEEVVDYKEPTMYDSLLESLR